ncbi:MAG: hypothetical protein U0U46_15290 [Saprospiraceae bacterium]
MLRFHISLAHLEDADGLEVNLHGTTFALSPHSDETRAHARATHAVLSRLSDEHFNQYSHYADIEPHHLEGDAPRWLQIVRPQQPGSHLQEVVLMSQIIPKDRLWAFYQSHMWKERYLRRHGQHLSAALRAAAAEHPAHHTGRLHALGLVPEPQAGDRHIEVLLAAQELVDTMTTAAGLVAHHPNLATTQTSTAAYIRDNNILPNPAVDPNQYNAMRALKAQLDKNPSWSPIIDCVDKDGNPIKAGYDFGEFQTGQQLQTFAIVDNVLSASVPATSGAQRSTSDDVQLRNQTWSPAPGTSAFQSTNVDEPVRAAAMAAGDPQFKWTVPYQTYTNGIKMPKDSLKIDSSNNFSIDCYNLYNRTLYVAYELFDDAGKSKGPRTLMSTFSAVDNIMGIPIPVVPTVESFNIGDAAEIRMYFGSLGGSNWDKVSWHDGNVSDRGALFTGAYQYGVPIVFMIAGKAITSTQTFNKIVNDPQLRVAAAGILFGLVGGAVPTYAALTNWKSTMIKFGNVVISFAAQKGMETLGKWLVAQVGAGQLSKAFGPVGWLFQLIAAGLSIEQMVITTAESLSSDSLTTAVIKRAIDVKLNLHPDPKHGEVGHPDTAVWPSVATNYVATLQCKAGTNFVIKGELPSTTSGKPVSITFVDVPAGGQFRIFIGLYSANGWLAGSWQNDWTVAKANQGTTLDLGDQNITENLVPLAMDTQYVYKEKIVYKDAKFSWANDTVPATTLRSLDCTDSGGLCELTAITVNNSAFQVGYAWRAAKQHLHPDSPDAPVSDNQLYAVQNLSVLENPSSRLKTTQIGFTHKPGIAYALSLNTQNTIDQTNFVLDPRNGKMNLRKVTLDDGQTDFGFGDPNLLSWGSFPLDNVDALAIHPSNSVLACSFSSSKLMILRLPDQGMPDGQAPEALLVSGEGIREGLMRGPKALAVAPDGRVLVLESVNNRVQAFDLNGNAVPSFTPNAWLFQLKKADVAASLDAGNVPSIFMDGLVNAKQNMVGLIDSQLVAELDGGQFQPQNDPLMLALSALNINLAYDPDNMSDPTLSAQIQVVQAGQSWIITDPRQQAWQIVQDSGLLNVYNRPVTPSVEVQAPGDHWLLRDSTLGLAWLLVVSSGSPDLVEVFDCFTYFPLQQGPNNENLNYLDMAVESQGFLYVLSYINDGNNTTDYLLDVYAPDGTFLFRSPDASKGGKQQNIVAGRIAVDIWRDLYALNFETLNGPNGAIQPGIAHWMPTPPLFSFPLSEQPNFNAQNISAVAKDFADHGITLSNNAFILVNNPDGAWEVKDGNTIYHVYRSGGALQVYNVPA